MELSQGDPLLSSDPNTKGFDLTVGNDWIYPLNYQFREYQYNITKSSLFGNTLVCLPTGLGKTLIAAVVMYNFWRWYPRGKIIFLAPTKPLVAQQIYACHDIMGIPSVDTIELTGSMNPKNRQVAWFTKRVIFATPQVFQNDLERDIAPGESVRCVVIDEAHKALGKHAYCESLRLLRARNSCFRVVALSATPGSRIDDVCQVIKNLFISNLELRDETSLDIIPYLNKKQMDIILVPLDKDLARFKEKYVSIMDPYVQLLVQYNLLKGDTSNISKGRVFYVYKEFKAKTNRPSNYSQIMKTISRCISLSHAYELLIRHGLRAFATFCQSHSNDTWMSGEPELQNLIVEILSFLGPFPNLRPLPDGSIEEIPKDLVFGHTKFHKLKSLLAEHFEKCATRNEETRAIVFVEYRDSVNEVYVSLLQLRPILRPKMFVGQAGQKRKQQMQAMAAFRNNEANVLISTSVGEEGLDVGEVDLIICFDISQSSPIRLVQRMGRTGRRRDGRIVMLVTDGKEHQALKSTIARKDSLNKKVLHSSNVVSALYQESPRMVPPDLNPVCSKMHIVLQPKTPLAKGKRKRKQKDDDPPEENKRKATTAKVNAVLPSEFEKRKPTQSSMLKFLNKPSTSKGFCEVPTQASQTIQGNQISTQIPKPECVKLFTSDAAAIEFLTLCAIKASKLDDVRNELNRMDETYLTISAHDDLDNIFDYPAPDLEILNFVSHLEKGIEQRLSPEFVQDYEFDHFDNDVYLPENNQLNAVQYRDTNNSPAVGNFNYEDLFEDSCESDEIGVLDGQRATALGNNTKLSRECEEIRQSRSNDKSNKVDERQSQKKIDSDYAALFEDDFFEKSDTTKRLLDQVCDTNKPVYEEEDNFLKIGCFESILDTSSDSDIPLSQTDLDLRKNTKPQGINPENYAVYEKPSQIDIVDSKTKASTSFANNSLSRNQNRMYSSMSENSKSSSNIPHPSNSETVRKTVTPNMNQNTTNNNSLHYNDRKASCLPKALDQSFRGNKIANTSSRFVTSKHNESLVSGTGLSFKTEAKDTIVKSQNPVINKTSNGNESINEHFAEPLDEDDDDDVIFVGEISTITNNNERRKNSIGKTFMEDDNEVLFKKEVSSLERKEANKSSADCSKFTLTQILEFIDNSTQRNINLSKISKNSQNLSKSKRSQSLIATTTAHTENASLSQDEKALKDYFKSPDPCTSDYFVRKNHIVNNIDVSSKTEEPLNDLDLDLSDIKWEDDFEDEKINSSYNKAAVRSDTEVNSNFKQSRTDNSKTSSMRKKNSFKTNSEGSEYLLENKIDNEKSLTDLGESRLINKKEESFKTNSDSSGLLFQTNIEPKKSSQQKIMDFDLADYEWDSDFETPANPVASLKQFADSNSIYSQKKLDNASTSGLASEQLSPKSMQPNTLSNSVVSTKKKLSFKKKGISKPSATKDVFLNSDDSDFEENFFRRVNGKPGEGHNSSINYVFSTNRNPMISKGLKLSDHEKENTEPNSGQINLNIFSSDWKDRDLRRLPLSRGVSTTNNREKVHSLNRDRYKKKKSQKQKKIKSDFIDYEAEVSSNTSSGSSGEDDDLDGFVSHTQHEPVTLDMQAHYLQSLKHVHETNPFCFKKPRAFVPDDEVFSQPISQVEESTYLHDSFCVSGGEDDLFAETREDSLLELTERELRNKKRKRSKNATASISKKRKVAERLSDDSNTDDETEKLREQILEESMILKRNKND